MLRKNRWNWMVRLLLLVILSMPLLGMAPASAAPPVLHGQPALLRLASEQPETQVSVIVQKSLKDDQSVEALVAGLGGTVTTDLSIINAFAAELPAAAATELAQAPGVRWISLDAPVQQTGSLTSANFITWATSPGNVVADGFANSSALVSGPGPDLQFGSGARTKSAVGGFSAEYTPGLSIVKVEAVLQVYVPATLASTEAPKLTAYLDGKPGAAVKVAASQINAFKTDKTAGPVYVDLTASRAWKWSDFSADLQLLVDQSLLATNHTVFYDAIGLRITAGGGSDATTPLLQAATEASAPISTFDPAVDQAALSRLAGDTGVAVPANVFQQAVRATNVWNAAPGYVQGSGVTVAVVDSGVARKDPFGHRLLGNVNFNSAAHTAMDGYGHGTYVGGIIADDGSRGGGTYTGVAPKANLFNVRVSDDQGASTESDVVNALQWVLNNRSAYNIRVINLSLNSSQAQAYNVSPLDAACEILWFNGVVVVVSAGNNGTATLYPPANDPFVITVGAADDRGTATLGDDVVASFSAYGTTGNGVAKPDLVAPGRNVVAYMPDNGKLKMPKDHPDKKVGTNYFSMSGTSVSAPLVSGAVAMLLQDEPNLTPDQVKYRLKATANKAWPGYNAAKAGAGYLDVYAAVRGTTTQSANTGLAASQLLWSGSTPITWGSVQWNSVQWNSVQWNSVQWNSVQWNSVQWNSDYWGS